MVVICGECGLKYQIDPSKIQGNSARFNCKGCATPITIHKPEEIEIEDFTDLEEVLASEEQMWEDSGDDEAGDSETTVEEFFSEESEGSSDAAATLSEKSQHLRKKTGFGLTTKVILLMLLVSLLPGAIYFGLSFKESNKRIAAETEKTGTLVTGLLASEVDDWIDKNARPLKVMAKLPGIVSMNQFDQEVVLQALQKEYPWMYLVFTTDERGMNVARSDGKPLKDYSNRQYVKDVVSGADLAWQNLIGKTSNKPALVLAVPIKKDEKTVGVLATAMTREAISSLVANFRQGLTGSSFLVDQKSIAVAHQNNVFVLKEQDMSTHPLIQKAKQGVAQKTEFIDANGKETIGFSQKTKLGWILAIQQEKDEAFQSLERARLFAYSLLGLTVIIILIIAILASRALVTPIRRLTDAANRISVGDLEVEINETSKDEIGDLADAVVRMQDSIKLSISRLQRKRG